jgi:hypothetical protein
MKQPGGYTDRRSAFLTSLERLEQWLGAEQIPYAVFGSVAAAAWTDQGASLDFSRPGARRPADSIPDIDLLVPRASLDRVKRYAHTARRSDFPVSIDTFWSECWIDYRPGSQTSYLTHRALRIPVRTDLLTPSTARLAGQQVAVVDPRTLLHIYGTVNVARRKDTPRIAALTEALASGTLTSRFTDQDCQALDTFARARTRRYPLFFAAKHAWVRLTDALPPRAAQALRHHIELRANDAFRRVSRRQDRRSRR